MSQQNKHMKVQSTSTPGLFKIIKQQPPDPVNSQREKTTQENERKNSPKKRVSYTPSIRRVYRSRSSKQPNHRPNSVSYHNNPRSRQKSRSYGNENTTNHTSFSQQRNHHRDYDSLSMNRHHSNSSPRKSQIWREEDICYAGGSWSNIPSPDELPIPSFLSDELGCGDGLIDDFFFSICLFEVIWMIVINFEFG